MRAFPVVTEQAELPRPVVSQRPRSEDEDLCRARDLQWLVGRSRADIPVPVDVINRRVTCTTCPVTQDYSPYRLNILLNAQTDRVEIVRCG